MASDSSLRLNLAGLSAFARLLPSKARMGWSETIVQKDSYEADFERTPHEVIIKALEVRANKLGVKIGIKLPTAFLLRADEVID